MIPIEALTLYSSGIRAVDVANSAGISREWVRILLNQTGRSPFCHVCGQPSDRWRPHPSCLRPAKARRCQECNAPLPLHRLKYCSPECREKAKTRARMRRFFARFKAANQRAMELIRRMEVVDAIPNDV